MIYVGRFTERDLKEGTDKKAVEQKKKETGLQYVNTKIITKNGKNVAIDIWVCNAHEFKI